MKNSAHYLATIDINLLTDSWSRIRPSIVQQHVIVQVKRNSHDIRRVWLEPRRVRNSGWRQVLHVPDGLSFLRGWGSRPGSWRQQRWPARLWRLYWLLAMQVTTSSTQTLCSRCITWHYYDSLLVCVAFLLCFLYWTQSFVGITYCTVLCPVWW